MSDWERWIARVSFSLGVSLSMGGCGDCFDQEPKPKDRTGLAMEGSFVVTDFSDDPQAYDTPEGQADEARLVMNDTTATLTVRYGNDEYQFVYAMTADENRSRRLEVHEE